GLQISGCSHVELYALDFAGVSENALNIDDGENPDRPSHHVTLRNVRVRNLRRTGNVDAIKLSGVDDFLVADCAVGQWGNGGSGVRTGRRPGSTRSSGRRSTPCGFSRSRPPRGSCRAATACSRTTWWCSGRGGPTAG